MSPTEAKKREIKGTRNNDRVVSSSKHGTSLPIDGDFENPKKTTMFAKSTKISTRTKKVLADKNVSFDTLLQKYPTLEPRTSFGGEYSEDLENSNLVPQLGSSPYDPLTNYLSPRPKFLRYKPEMRQELLSRLEIATKEGRDGLRSSRSELIDPLEFSEGTSSEAGLMDSCVLLSGSSKEGNVKIPESEEIEESGDEYQDNYMEDRCYCNLRGVLKLLMLLVVLVVSTLYISSMNSPTSIANSPMLQAVADIRDGLLKGVRNGANFLVNRESTQLSDLELDVTFADKVVSELIGDVHNGDNEGLEMPKSMEVADSEDQQKAAVDELVRTEDIENEESSGPYGLGANEEHNGLVSKISREVLHTNIKVTEEDHDLLIAQAKQGKTTSSMVTNGIIASESSKAIGASILFSVVGSLILTVLHFKRKRAVRNHIPSAVAEPIIGRFVTTRSNSVPLKEGCDFKQWLEDISNTKSLMALKEEEISKAMSQIGAPSVELLGEFVVGEERSSLKSHELKSGIVNSEVSSHSVSVEKTLSRRTQSVAVSLQPPISTISATKPTPLISQKKTAKKQQAKGDGSASMLMETPLRRSSRIRNHPTTSPSSK